ncbi:hypothetical protein EIP75_18175 [Aquabacterium soli]|jgi:hypothetical protein|uniref:Uncharacterized protein n=1 Tax=Aquabacterium soli TaxID=2493092 RepID=A0A3R8U1V0_9BURK|nr:hypothetical protein [Aquabacterium soli]RRS02887.1 hypothetical protein EIP75_18175 [Aquabacterium soli]
MKEILGFRTDLAQLLLIALPLASVHHARAATDRYYVGEFGGSLYLPWTLDGSIVVTPGASGATAHFTGPRGGGLIRTSELAIAAKSFDFLVDGSFSYAPAIVTDNQIHQAFTSDVSFSMQLLDTPWAPSDQLLSGVIVGGSITGQLGSTTNIQISLEIENLTSSVIALATDTTTITWTGYSLKALSTTCFTVGGQCAFSDTYLGSLSLGSLTWSLPSSALASAIPEPQIAWTFGLGLALLAIRKICAQ